jgi:hypothetical protein
LSILGSPTQSVLNGLQLKEDLRQEIEEHDRRKIQALAEIELQEEMEAVEEENNVVNERGDGMEDEEASLKSEGIIMEEDAVDKSTEVEITADSGIEPDVAPVKKVSVCSPPDCATPG